MSRRKQCILLLILLSYGVIAIDSSIVITGLTKIAADLQLTQVTLSWVQNAYVLAFGGCILLSGKLSDVFGRKRVLNTALVLFGAASAVAGAATTGSIMLVARVVQGVSAAMLAPTSLALLMDTFTGEERVKAVSWYSSISGLGSSVGLVLGGFLANVWSWRVGFYVNVPVTLLMLAISLKYLQYTPKRHEPFDMVGTLLSVTGIFAFVYAINGAAHVLPWLIPALILLVTFVYHEKKSTVPIMPLSLFASSIRTGAYVMRLFYMCAMMGFWFLLSEYLQHVLGFTPFQAGLGFIPMTLSLFVAAVLVPRLTKTAGPVKVIALSIMFLAASLVGAFFLTSTSSYAFMVTPLLILSGLGQGFVMSPLTSLGIQDATPEISGVASGLVNVSHFVGGSLGLSIMVSLGEYMPTMMSKFHLAMIIGFCFIACMALTGLLSCHPCTIHANNTVLLNKYKRNPS